MVLSRTNSCQIERRSVKSSAVEIHLKTYNHNPFRNERIFFWALPAEKSGSGFPLQSFYFMKNKIKRIFTSILNATHYTTNNYKLICFTKI